MLPAVGAEQTRSPNLAASGGVPSGIGADGAPTSPALQDVERAHIVEVLRRTKGRIEGPAGAASALGMNPSTLRSRIKKLDIRRTDEPA
jgi:transcriptional regulator with GAF, ATPase, and Fis domain